MALRAFVGVPIPREERLAALLDALGAVPADLKVVSADHLHMTLSFLGDVPEDAPPKLAEALDEAVRGVPSFCARLAAVGAFPNARRPRVVWAGVEDPRPLVALADAVRAGLLGAGFRGDDKDFRAHVTLARVRSEQGLGAVVDFLRRHAAAPLPDVDVGEVRLFRSTLTPEGPRYETLHVARLEA